VAGIGIAVPPNVAAGCDLARLLSDGPPLQFRLRATPKGNPVGERCGTLAIDQSSVKTAASAGCCW
jgi:hypothetical protein